MIGRGMPLVQIIPFRRADAALRGVVRAETAEEAAMRERIFRQTLASEGWCRR